MKIIRTYKDMDILSSLKNKNDKKEKNKSKRIPEKFKYYSQDIDADNEGSNLDEYNLIKDQLLGIDLNQNCKEINKEEMKYLENLTHEQCMAIIKEEFEDNSERIYNEKKPNKTEIIEMIKKSENISIYSDEEEEIINKKNIKVENKNEDEKKEELIVENLNEKYKFILGDINWNDITIKDINSKKLIYHNMGFYKSATDYKNYAYFS